MRRKLAPSTHRSLAIRLTPPPPLAFRCKYAVAFPLCISPAGQTLTDSIYEVRNCLESNPECRKERTRCRAKCGGNATEMPHDFFTTYAKNELSPHVLGAERMRRGRANCSVRSAVLEGRPVRRGSSRRPSGGTARGCARAEASQPSRQPRARTRPRAARPSSARSKRRPRSPGSTASLWRRHELAPATPRPVPALPPPRLQLYTTPHPPSPPPPPPSPSPWHTHSESGCIPLVTPAEAGIVLGAEQEERAVCLYARSFADERLEASRCFAPPSPMPPPPPPAPELRLSALAMRAAQAPRQGGWHKWTRARASGRGRRRVRRAARGAARGAGGAHRPAVGAELPAARAAGRAQGAAAGAGPPALPAQRRRRDARAARRGGGHRLGRPRAAARCEHRAVHGAVHRAGQRHHRPGPLRGHRLQAAGRLAHHGGGVLPASYFGLVRRQQLLGRGVRAPRHQPVRRTAARREQPLLPRAGERSARPARAWIGPTPRRPAGTARADRSCPSRAPRSRPFRLWAMRASAASSISGRSGRRARPTGRGWTASGLAVPTDSKRCILVGTPTGDLHAPMFASLAALRGQAGRRSGVRDDLGGPALAAARRRPRGRRHRRLRPSPTCTRSAPMCARPWCPSPRPSARPGWWRWTSPRLCRRDGGQAVGRRNRRLHPVALAAVHNGHRLALVRRRRRAGPRRFRGPAATRTAPTTPPPPCCAASARPRCSRSSSAPSRAAAPPWPRPRRRPPPAHPPPPPRPPRTPPTLGLRLRRA